MSIVSSLELSGALAHSRTELSHLKMAVDVLERSHVDPAFKPLDAAEEAMVLALPLGKPKAISRAGAALLAARDEIGSERMLRPAVAARQVLALSRRLSGPEGGDLETVELGSFPSAERSRLQEALYDADLVSDAEIVKLGGSRSISEFVINDADRQNSLSAITRFESGEAASGFDGAVITALKVIDIEATRQKLEPAVERVYASRRLSGIDLPMAEIARRISGDVVHQMQAEKALDPGQQQGLLASFSKVPPGSPLGLELETQAAGKFASLPRGAQLDISDDLGSTDFLPEIITKSIDGAARRSGIDASGMNGANAFESGRDAAR